MTEERDKEPKEDLQGETEGFWDDPRKVMALIDLLFLWDDPEGERPLS